MEHAYHYPSDLLNLLVDTVATLVRSKEAVVDFFRSAGLPQTVLEPWLVRIREGRENVRKTEITRSLLCYANDLGDAGLRIRREIIKRVVEWEEFSSCYPDKQIIAEGLVAKVRRVVNVKDSFTQMNQERERDRSARQQAYQAELQKQQQHNEERVAIQTDLYALFSNGNAHRRGKALERVLNRFFAHSGLLVREAFTLVGPSCEGVIEQIDGAIQHEGELYLVEMKWWNSTIGPGEVNSHLSRLMTRAEARGLFISASGFTPAAIESVRSFLNHRLCVLCDLNDIVRALDSDTPFADVLRRKVHHALMNKDPLLRT